MERDFRVPDTTATGASGLSVESVFRRLLLKQILKVSYEKLLFHLCDSPLYGTFARLQEDQLPSRSGLQSTIRHITPETLEHANQLLMSALVEDNIQFGHKINLATQKDAFIIYCRIEDGNRSDAALYMPVLDARQSDYKQMPDSVVADGCYASQENVKSAKVMGVKRNVFSKPVGLTLGDMGVKRKTFDILRNFRAGVEGNISEFKRAFGAGKATWKGHDGFKAFVWSLVLSYNLIRMVRFSSA